LSSEREERANWGETFSRGGEKEDPLWKMGDKSPTGKGKELEVDKSCQMTGRDANSPDYRAKKEKRIDSFEQRRDQDRKKEKPALTL